MSSSKPHISFVLSSLNRSGGSRVTVEMGNRLVERGYAVRILHMKTRPSMRRIVRAGLLRMRGLDYKDWGTEFEGDLELFGDLNEVVFDRNEVVIGVGTEAIPSLRNLHQEVMKVRFCHGLALNKPVQSRHAWSGAMPTIAVSGTLAPALKELGCERFIGVVPNGIRTDCYYDEGRERDGIGMVFGTHYNKAPEDSLELLSLIMQRWPEMPLYVFGESKRPSILPEKYYYRYPSVDKARELYNRSKVWLMASRMEGLPGPSLEAMACGAAFISTDNLGSAEVVRDGENGVLVPVGHPKAFLEPTNLLLSDETRRRKLVESARRTVAHFSWDRAVDRMIEVLDSIQADQHI